MGKVKGRGLEWVGGTFENEDKGKSGDMGCREVEGRQKTKKDGGGRQKG